MPHGIKRDEMFFEVKTEESEEARSRLESKLGHLVCAASALPPSYDNQTTTNPHNPLYCTGGTEVSQAHTWQPLSMCCQNSVRGQPKNSLHSEGSDIS